MVKILLVELKIGNIHVAGCYTYDPNRFDNLSLSLKNFPYANNIENYCEI